MASTGFVHRHATGLALMFDAVALTVFFCFIPRMRRPFEFLALTVFFLGLFTVLIAKPGLARNLSLTAAVVGATVFGLEMAEKIWEVTSIFLPPAETYRSAPPSPAVSTAPYLWDGRSTADYLAVRERAAREGLSLEALETAFAGDVFAGRDAKTLWTRKVMAGGKIVTWQGLNNRYSYGAPFGYELTPDNVVRYSCRDTASGRMVVDTKATINGSGFRHTRGNERAEEVYVFIGCSMTFGFGLSDDETLPHYFSESTGFRHNVLNLGVSGYGPHQSLRDLELNLHMDRAGVDDERVRAVVFSLLDDHARRAENPSHPGEPRYVLENGELRFVGPIPDSFVGSRLMALLDRGRIYPKLRSIGQSGLNSPDGEYRWRLAHAILLRMDALCRERYGVGMTVVHWDDDPSVRDPLTAAGIRVIGVDDVFEAGWRHEFIKYAIYDGHPSAYANRHLGMRLVEELAPAADNPNAAGRRAVFVGESQ